VLVAHSKRATSRSWLSASVLLLYINKFPYNKNEYQGKASRHFAQPPLSCLMKKTPEEKGRKCATRTLNIHPILISIESQDKIHTRT